MDDIQIGLFGTCGKSTWREPFIEKYNQLGISYFNPQVPDGMWNAGCVAQENKHLMEDDIILFPITSETTGQGSLAEIGFSIQAAISRRPDRYFIYLIDNDCTDESISGAQRQDSIRTRILVKSKLIIEARKNSGIYVVDNLQNMLDLSVTLYYNVKNMWNLQTQYGI